MSNAPTLATVASHAEILPDNAKRIAAKAFAAKCNSVRHVRNVTAGTVRFVPATFNA